MYSPAACRRTTTSTTNVNPTPIAIQPAHSIAASLGADGVRLAVHDEQVDEQQGDDEPEQDDPVPQVDVDVDEVAVALRGARRRSSRGSEPAAADDRLRRGEAGDRHAERRAAHVVEADLVEQRDRLRVAAVLAADAELEFRLAPCAHARRRA